MAAGSVDVKPVSSPQAGETGADASGIRTVRSVS